MKPQGKATFDLNFTSPQPVKKSKKFILPPISIHQLKTGRILYWKKTHQQVNSNVISDGAQFWTTVWPRELLQNFSGTQCLRGTQDGTWVLPNFRGAVKFYCTFASLQSCYFFWRVSICFTEWCFFYEKHKFATTVVSIDMPIFVGRSKSSQFFDFRTYAFFNI